MDIPSIFQAHDLSYFADDSLKDLMRSLFQRTPSTRLKIYASSLEFWAQKDDASMFVIGQSMKKNLRESSSRRSTPRSSI